jgi:hypothetical protein
MLDSARSVLQRAPGARSNAACGAALRRYHRGVAGNDRVEALIGELVDARRDLFAAVDRLDPGARLVGEWGARELIAHLGYWVGHAAEAIHTVEQGRAAEFDVADHEVDERNATVARVARQTNLATVRRREEGSFEALVERLRALDPALLDVRLADWGTLEAGIREDGAVHYREHLDQLPPP